MGRQLSYSWLHQELKLALTDGSKAQNFQFPFYKALLIIRNSKVERPVAPSEGISILSIFR
ncbi:hypothetical protein [Shewanella sp. SR44-3]|uniref:hypothetical protein n=1 Tax=Shewanella sp. SR44-3 TaxID=2760936 RepID=UPI0015F9DD5F|nr:hypothetical protein [Shewanella sp. SR44-3]MBB1269586.1 hypothetical protein [Shewanella sp. SR44-3]